MSFDMKNYWLKIIYIITHQQKTKHWYNILVVILNNKPKTMHLPLFMPHCFGIFLKMYIMDSKIEMKKQWFN